MATTLHKETVDLGSYVRVALGDFDVEIQIKSASIRLAPLTRQDANRMSIALKKAARRLQDIGPALPEESTLTPGNRNEK